ncbi:MULTISPECIES: NfeD family protein [Rhodopseudomonas]|uniref:Membrane protein n=1 Tax=Rhodopseudomonas palustris TaxID=1076 RepID=A0A0D7EMA0_RHOPL|nr:MULTISPECIES: NfeD family protein [Rhodopseudomonas]KIZ40582.1 membrane protein [Rhodopseudomonas palustris]MDF3812635.1 NfeD family protein [Rhodopseudomonas sp. BAL398]WOK17115.1 NfeD family protein [Rhodopseudomonas sp. BAL398]
MIQTLLSQGHWTWLILGLVLMVLELLAPGVFLFWLGLAAMVVGLLSSVIALPWEAQILMFALVSVLAVPLWRGASGPKPGTNRLNKRGEALLGREFTLDKPIIDGEGRLRIDDTIWRIVGPDLPAGTRVQIAKAEGVRLTVAAIEPE